MRPIPREVTVHIARYDVRRVSLATLRRYYKAEVYADCDPLLRVIRIARGVSLRAAWGLLRHEVGHALIFELGFKNKIPNEHEEDTVEILLPAYVSTLAQLDPEVF